MSTQKPLPADRLGARNRAGAAHHAEYRRFYLEAYELIRQRARSMLRDDEAAQDATQETFARAWASWGILAHARSRMGWLVVTLTRLCIDRRRSLDLALELADRRAPQLPAGRVEDRHLAHLLRLRLRREDPICQRIVLDTWLGDLTQYEAAERLNLSRRTVQRYVEAFRARHADDLEALKELSGGL